MFVPEVSLHGTRIGTNRVTSQSENRQPVNMSIPVVDIVEVLSRSEELDSCDAVQELHSAFTTVGFVFIRNHGIDKKLVGTGNQLDLKYYTAYIVSQARPNQP